MQTPFVTISDAGIAFFDHRPARDPTKHDYSRRPVKVALHHDLTLELHGEHFSASTQLTLDDALGMISMLGYVLREHQARRPTEFTQRGTT